jgi:hypothetical protein
VLGVLVRWFAVRNKASETSETSVPSRLPTNCPIIPKGFTFAFVAASWTCSYISIGCSLLGKVGGKRKWRGKSHVFACLRGGLVRLVRFCPSVGRLPVDRVS